MDHEDVAKLKADSLADMSDQRRVRIGAGVSLFYLTTMAVYSYAQRGPVWGLSPNELGDFLAGTFAPLAFLWLVLGFFQQGVELRNSTRALLIQADELRNSVEQQRELVRVTTDQLEHEKGRASRAEEESERLARPKLLLRLNYTSFSQTSPNLIVYAFKLLNAGATCTDVSIWWKENAKSIHLAALPTGGTHDFQLALSEEEYDALSIHVSYVDARGGRREEELTVEPE